VAARLKSGKNFMAAKTPMRLRIPMNMRHFMNSDHVRVFSFIKEMVGA
jgi:hypothetical protein